MRNKNLSRDENKISKTGWEAWKLRIKLEKQYSSALGFFLSNLGFHWKVPHKINFTTVNDCFPYKENPLKNQNFQLANGNCYLVANFSLPKFYLPVVMGIRIPKTLYSCILKTRTLKFKVCKNTNTSKTNILV